MFTRKRKKFTPREYQEDAIKKGVSNPAYGFFMKPGLGKTTVFLAIFKVLKKLGYVDKLLVVSTKRVIRNTWPREIKKWSDFSDFSYSLLHGPKKDEALREDADVYGASIDNMEWLYEHKKMKKMAKLSPLMSSEKVMLVLDESSKVKSHKTNRFRWLRKLCSIDGFITNRYIGTGTPAPKSMMDVWSQVYILDAGDSLGEYITQFRHKYFYPSGFEGRDWKLQPGAEDTIYKNMEHIVSQYGDELLPDLPELEEIIRPVYLEGKARKQYDQMEEILIAEVEDGTIDAANAAVAYGKLQQMANGQLYDQEHKAHHIHDEKALELVEIIEELQGSPCLIGYHFDHDREAIQKALPDVALFESGMSEVNENALIDKWNAGEIPYLAGNIKSIAHGLNLQESGFTVVFYSLTNNFEDYEQFIRRLRRSGQKSGVVHAIHIVAEDTVDEDIMESNKVKDTNQNALLRAMQKRKKGDNMSTDTNVEILQKALGTPSFVNEEQSHGQQFLTGLMEKVKAADTADLETMMEKISGGESEASNRDELISIVEEFIMELFDGSVDTERSWYVLGNTDLAEIYLEDTLEDYYGPDIHATEESKPKKGKKTMKKSEKKIMKKPEKKTITEETTTKKDLDPKKVAKKKAKTQKAADKAVKKTAEKTATKKTATKKTATKKTATKKTAVVEFNAKSVVTVGEGTPAMPKRKTILELVPAGKRGIRMDSLVSKVCDELGCNENVAVSNINAMENKGFINIK